MNISTNNFPLINEFRERAKFFKNAILDHNVGAVATSSKYVVNNVLKRLKKPLHTVIEFGPGDGPMTKALLKRLSPDGRMLVIESNDKFIKDLREIGDKRLHIIEGNVQDIISKDIPGFEKVDLIVSSIPFTFLTPSERIEVVTIANKLLIEGGSFIIFHQYSLLMAKTLRQIFGKVTVDLEPRNFPPCFILECSKSKKIA